MKMNTLKIKHNLHIKCGAFKEYLTRWKYVYNVSSVQTTLDCIDNTIQIFEKL